MSCAILVVLCICLVAIDLNQIFHLALRKCTNRASLIIAVSRQLDVLMNACRPRKSLFLAFDGPAPVAKLKTQRKRRERSKPRFIKTSKGGRGGGPNAKKCLDSFELTPGCEMLYHIRDAIEYWAHYQLQKNPYFENVDIHISGPDVPGEGELKIIDYCHVSRIPPSDSIIVVGGDSDIVLQALATVSVRNFFIYIQKGFRSDKCRNYVLSIWKLAQNLERLFPGDSLGSRIDFIFLAILNGNGMSNHDNAITIFCWKFPSPYCVYVTNLFVLLICKTIQTAVQSTRLHSAPAWCLTCFALEGVCFTQIRCGMRKTGSSI